MFVSQTKRKDMRDVLKYVKHLALVGFLLCSTSMYGVISLTGAIGGSTYTDATINFTGDCTLAAASSAIILTTGGVPTIDVNTNTADRLVTGTGSSGTNQFVFNAALDGHVINLNLTDNLTFISGTTSTDPFLVLFTGQGTLNIIISDSQTLTFSGNDTVDFGTRFLINMNADNTSEVTVQRASVADDLNTISLTKNSLIGFMAATPSTSGPTTEDGELQFWTSSTNTRAEMILDIDNNCSFVIQGYDISSGSVTAGTVVLDYTEPAGREAKVQIVETDVSSVINSLRVINSNTVIPRLYRNPFGDTETYTGIRPGFILGSNGYLEVLNNTYLDYIATATNRIPQPTISNTLLIGGEVANEVIKNRNGSALVVDGWDPNTSTAGTGHRAAKIFMSGDSGMFFRSGASRDGVVYHDYTVSVTDRTPEAGEIVFDIEAELSVSTSNSGTKVINVLSREVDVSGGLIEIGSGSEAIFPSIIDPQAVTRSYNTANILVNNPAYFDGVTLRHDDYNRIVYDMNSPESAPTYVGGESFKLLANASTPYTTRPSLRWFNSRMNLHSGAAFTGVDNFYPNLVDGSTTSTVAFYQNGYLMEQSLSTTIGLAPGRNLILGTTIGSTAQDGTTVIDRASYFDVFQDLDETAAGTHVVNFINASNNDTQLTGISGDIDSQTTVQTLFLGHQSNMQIGTSTSFTDSPTSTVNIAGNFFSFETQGGQVGLAELSGSTGEGGMFIDSNGVISIGSAYRCNMGMMVVKSGTGVITLDKNKVFFDSRVGITEWNLDFSSTQTIIASSANLSDFTLDWVGVLKDYAGGFIPFQPTTNNCPTVTTSNMYHIPIVNGVVDQFQVKRSRLGDQFSLLVDNGRVNELVMLNGYDSSEAPVGTLFIKNNGRAGIGNNSEDADSLYGNVKLGVNGLTIVADGDGVIDILSDVVVDNVCHIVVGPNFATTAEDGDALIIRSQQPQELRVRTGGVLDLSTFDDSTKRVIIGGELSVVMERNSKIIMGGGILNFTANSKLTAQPYVDRDGVFGSDVSVTDSLRVKLIGSGEILFDQDAMWEVREDTYWGVETDSDNTATNLTFTFNDSGMLMIGSENEFGGKLQVGNTADGSGHSIIARFEMNGIGSMINIDSQGFLGFGAGIVRTANVAPDEWLIGSLFDVTDIHITNTQGTFSHNNTLPGSNSDAALFAVGPAGDGTVSGYHLTLSSSISSTAKDRGRFLGGGNMVLIDSGVTSVAPVVATTTGASGDLDDRGILCSTPLLNDAGKDAAKAALAATPTPTNFFNMLKVDSVATVALDSKKATFAPFGLASAVAGLVNGTTIIRDSVIPTAQGIIGSNGKLTQFYGHAFSRGAVGVSITDATSVVNSYSEEV